MTVNTSRLHDSIPLQKPLRGFSHINRYWDKTRQVYAAKILPGEFYVTIHDEVIVTVLGSCVSACVRDRVFGIGGMNHFMLPHSSPEDANSFNGVLSEATRYGNYAMEHLINVILANGGRRENLEVKIVGGGRIITGMSNIGLRNVEFVKAYIASEGLTLLGEDVGGTYPRKVVYSPRTGKVQVKKLRNMHNTTIIDREERYMHELEHKPVAGEVELF